MNFLDKYGEKQGRTVLIGVFLISLLYLTAVAESGHVLGAGLFVLVMLAHGYAFGHLTVGVLGGKESVMQLISKYFEDLLMVLVLYISALSLTSAISTIIDSGVYAFTSSPVVFLILFAAAPTLSVLVLLFMLGVSHKWIIIVSSLIFSVAWTVLLMSTITGILFTFSWLLFITITTGLSLTGLSTFLIVHHIRTVRS